MAAETSGSTRRRTFSQDEFDAFARLSGDDNPIHTDPEFSAVTRFGRPVAHGMFLFSVVSGAVGELSPGSTVDEIVLIFPAPTYAGEEMEIEVAVDAENGGSGSFTFEIRNPTGEASCRGSGTLGERP